MLMIRYYCFYDYARYSAHDDDAITPYADDTAFPSRAALMHIFARARGAARVYVYALLQEATTAQRRAQECDARADHFCAV